MGEGTSKCSRHEEHERRLNELRTAVDNMRNKISELDKANCVRDEHYSMVTEQLIESNKELSGTLKEVARTMTDMREEIASTNTKMESFTSKMDDLEESVGSVREKIGEFEKRDSISILGFLKKNAVSIAIAAGAIIYYFTQKGVL